MINTRTLATHYPVTSSLTATQLISLHLLLHRPTGDGESLDPIFGPYISVLPRNFESHPVTWSVRREVGENGVDTGLLDNLPPSANAALQRISQKFWDDWKAVYGYLVPTKMLNRKFNEGLTSLSSGETSESHLEVRKVRFEARWLRFTKRHSSL